MNTEENDRPRTVPGLIEHQGAEAATAAREDLRAARHGGDTDPLEGLATRITAEGRPEMALDPLVIAAAAELRAEDGVAFDVLRRELKACGVSLTLWSKALDVHDRQRRRAEKDSAREERRRAALEARAAADARRSAEREARKAERAAARETERAAHFGETEHDGDTFVMRPGRVELVTEDKHGEAVVRTLGYFSAPLVEVLSEVSAPEAEPARTVVLSLHSDRETSPRRVELSAEAFGAMLWPAAYGATVGTGPGVRELLRCALERLSEPARLTRYGFTGWARDGGAWRYLSAGEVLGAEGPVAGVAVRATELAAGYALPRPAEGDELARGLARLAGVLTLAPSNVLVPLFGATFRAPLGPSRCALHLVGAPTVGKTFAALWFARLFGPRVEALDWTTSTAVGLKRSLAAVGEALVVVDDLRVLGTRADEDTARKVDEVFRALFNRTGAAKGQRTGGVRAEVRGRCLVVSTGETLPSGHSLRSRVAMLDMGARAEGLPAEDLSGVMAAFLRWLAPQVDALQEPGALEVLDRDAAERAGLARDTRTAETFGAIALGLETFARFAAEHGVIVDLDAARGAIAAAAGASLEETAAENPAARALELLASALRSGAAHVRRQHPAGSSHPAEEPGAWGWENDPIAGWRPRGPCVGYLHHAHPGELLVDRGPLVGVLRAEASRQGHPLALDARGLGTALARAGALARTDGQHVAVKVALGGVRTRFLAVRLEAFEDPSELSGATPEGERFEV